MTPNDVFRPLGSFVIQIPSNVAASAEGGTPV